MKLLNEMKIRHITRQINFDAYSAALHMRSYLHRWTKQLRCRRGVNFKGQSQ